MIQRFLLACLVSITAASSAFGQATATPPHTPLAERPLFMEKDIAAGEPRAGHDLPDNIHPSEQDSVAIAAILKPAVDAAWQETAAAFKDAPTR